MHRIARSLLPCVAALALALVATVPAQAQASFVFSLYGSQEVPPRPSDARGHCVAIVSDNADLDEAQLLIHCTHDVENASAAHIHLGSRGDNGPVVFPLGTPPDGDPASPIFAIWDDDDVDSPFDDEMIAAALTEQLYVNIHSPRFPTGEIRGQFVRSPTIGTRRMLVPLTADDVVPPTGGDESGACLLEVDNGQQQATIHCVHDVAGATTLTLREGERGENGPILFSFDGASPVMGVFDLDAEILEALESGQLYLQVSAGDQVRIRGQADRCIEGRSTLCLQESRFEVRVDFETVQNGGSSGDATAVELNDESGTFWFFSPDNTELLIKVLDGCAINGHYWVFYSATTNVGFTVTVTDHDTDTVETYTNQDLTEADPRLDTAAFATCP